MRPAPSARGPKKYDNALAVQVADDVPVEINPLWAMDADQVAERAQPGAVIDEATFLT